MANSIEGPANKILEKIRERDELTETDKQILSEYIVVMMKRVPKGKERLDELAPSVIESFSQEIEENLSIAASTQPEKAEVFERRKAEIERILDKYSKELPKKIWLNNIPPESSPRVVSVIASMTWRFLTYDQSPVFLTSDNPVFYFTSIGIGRPDSEVTLPISSNVTLWASWRSDLSEGYFPTTKNAVKEINRRTASNTTRFVFHCKKENWILPFIKKGRWLLHRLQ